VLDGKVYIYTKTDAGKAKRLRNSPRSRLAPSDVRGNVKGDWRDTNARIIADKALVDRVYAALQKKYGFQFSAATFFARLAGQLDARVYIEVDY
jgi:PPOX class probable F420-dependent enzyme